MKIVTKYNIGDRVAIFVDGTIILHPIASISTYHDSTGNSIYYLINEGCYSESVVYKDKDTLIASMSCRIDESDVFVKQKFREGQLIFMQA